MYKLMAVDMDGTLLNSKGEITQPTVDAIKLAVNKGLLFTISTGRPIQGVKLYDSILDLDAPIITYNGAMIVQSKTGEILFEKTLAPHDAELIMQCAEQFDTTMCVWSKNQLYANKLNRRVEQYKQLSGVEPILIKDKESLINQGITKILWYDDADNIDNFQVHLSNIKFDSLTYCTSKPVFLEFFNSEVSKAVALQKIGQLYNITQAEMIAVGDGNNDLSMIEYAGLGVAMSNAPASLKQKADAITTSCDQDGVAKVINDYFLSVHNK